MNVSKVRVIERDVLEDFDVLKGAMIYHYLKDDIANLTLNDNKIEVLLEVGVEILDSWQNRTPRYIAKSISFFLNSFGSDGIYGEILRDMTNYDYDLLFEEILNNVEDIVANEIA